MTTYDHAMLGACGVLATGWHRRFGWPLVASAAFLAVLPDWDGLSLLLGPALFDKIHRAAGHNLLVCTLLGAVAAGLDYRYSLVCRTARFVKGRLPRLEVSGKIPIRQTFRSGELAVWMLVGMAASLSHLATDLVFSGHANLTDWGLPLLWPFSDRCWVYPMVRWGDAVPTVLFVVGMFAMLQWPSRVAWIGRLTLLGVMGYIIVRGTILQG